MGIHTIAYNLQWISKSNILKFKTFEYFLVKTFFWSFIKHIFLFQGTNYFFRASLKDLTFRESERFFLVIQKSINTLYTCYTFRTKVVM